MVETHVHVATTREGIPQKNGNPIPGKFKYKQTSQPYSIPLSWGTGTQLFIAAHAVLVNSKTGQTETAWGALSDGYGYGYGFSGKNWATYFPYSVQ